MRSKPRSIGALCALLLLLMTGFSADAAPASRPVPAAGKMAPKKPLVWMENFMQAQRLAQKVEKPMLLYFSASDWDDWTIKLDKEVMNTPLWTDWAAANLILVKIDYPKNVSKQRPETKNQADMMRTRFNIGKVPTLIFLDPWGDLLYRCGYDTAKLQDDEAEDQPKKWLAKCQEILASRPAKERLQGYPDITTAVAGVRKTAIPLCILVTQTANNKVAAGWTETLLNNQLFLRWINRNMGFIHIEWPDDLNTGEQAKAIREFAAKWKFGPSPFQLVIWNPGGLGDLKGIIGGFDPVDCAPIIKRMEPMLTAIDYGGGWIEDFKLAKAISAQQQKDMIISFVSTDAEYSKRMYSEIYDQKEFLDYAKKNLVLLKVDFPSEAGLAAKQSKALKEQNNMLADMFGIRGFPSVVVVNPKGQKILDAKYMKGGATAFVAELKKQIMKDKDRRTLISEEAAKNVAKD